jgi:hypothetical protein
VDPRLGADAAEAREKRAPEPKSSSRPMIRTGEISSSAG